MMTQEKIGLGGGCHWCTEAVFQSLKGVISVEQGYMSSTGEFSSFSEGVIVTFDSSVIHIKVLIEIHLLTHKSTKNHSMRSKYRSAIYTFSDQQTIKANQLLARFNEENNGHLVTQVLRFVSFKSSRDELINYYFKNPEKPFCETFINPKLSMLLKDFTQHVEQDKLNHLIKDITV